MAWLMTFAPFNPIWAREPPADQFNQSFLGGDFLTRARIRLMTLPARLPSLIYPSQSNDRREESLLRLDEASAAPWR
jgi:hypothetical protein